VLEDYGHYARIYQPMVFESKAVRNGDGPGAAYDAILWLHSAFRLVSLFQHYVFRVKGHIEETLGASLPESSALRVHLGASEIRESDSGVPGRESVFSFQGGRFFWKRPRHLRHPIVISFGPAMRASSAAKEVRQAVEELAANTLRWRQDAQSVTGE
jgi:hypothetical protein